MKKKILTTLSVVLVLGLAALGILAYLTDQDSDVNVMTLGNVQIEQIEQQLAEDGSLEPFKQAKDLYPGTEISKIVSVKNTGKSDCYFRTLIAFEDITSDTFMVEPNVQSTGDYICTSFNGPTYEFTADDGTKYVVMEFVGKTKLEPGKTTTASLNGVRFNETCTNEDMEALGGTYEVLVLSQAVQTEGFADATTALDTAFGDVTNEKVAEWFGGVAFPVILEDASAIIKAMTTLTDGTNITTKVSKITYGKPSEYPEIVGGGYESVEVDGVTTYYVPNGSNYDVYVLAEGVIYAPKNSKNMFNGMTNVTEIDTSNLDFSRVENALGMFVNCSNLESLDTASWDVSNMTNMQSLFYGCNKLEDIDVSNWDTSNVTNMRMVFFRCYELDNEILKGVENWDVSNVTNFYSMFKHARGLTNLDLSNWDTSSATTMSHMFANIGGLEELDLSGFDTSKVTDMSWMFYDASKLTTILVGDGWTTANVDVANTSRPFYNNQALVGGAGTTWLDVCEMANANRPWESSASLDYAIVDGGTSNPGLLTHK